AEGLRTYRIPEQQSIEVVDLALKLGIDVNAANAAGNTALHLAATPGVGTERVVNLRNNRIIELLVAHGATVNAKNQLRQTPLDQVLSCLECGKGGADIERVRALSARGREETAAVLRKLGATSENVIGN